MADEDVKGASGNTESEAQADAAPPDKTYANKSVTLTRKAGWWGILAIYGLLFLTTGWMAFFARDVNPSLQQGLQSIATQFPDADAKAVYLQMIQQEANEHTKKESLALQSFNVVLGSLLGFLSASAVTRIRENESA
ncbi:MAG TPA: hypothetical protein VGB17_09420 [Pyrinomonadaceae bacterium]|jgi:hypothetical protein